MEKLSGLVLDVHDDDGAILRNVFSSFDTVPELIKCAHLMSEEERAELPDTSFALVLHDEGIMLRKYACIDPGNTALSVEYFLKTAHKLPKEAQKTAAVNLVTACGWYGIDPPEELTKVAVGMGGLMTAANLAIAGPEIARETNSRAKKNMQVAGASGGAVNPSIAQPLKPVQ